MGINPKIALPVMMLNAAVTMAASSKQFIESSHVSWRGITGIIFGGVLGVLNASFFLSSLAINTLKILVVFVALYTGFVLVRSSFIRREVRKD